MACRSSDAPAAVFADSRRIAARAGGAVCQPVRGSSDTGGVGLKALAGCGSHRRRGRRVADRGRRLDAGAGPRGDVAGGFGYPVFYDNLRALDARLDRAQLRADAGLP